MFQGGAAALFAGVVLGAVGAGYLMYARRAASAPALACGVTLIVFPVFVASLWALILVGGVLVALPFVGAHFGWW